MLRSTLYACTLGLLLSASAFAQPLNFRMQEIDKSLTVGYAVHLVDMNADQRPDIVVVDSERVIWLENPTAKDPAGAWKLHTILQGGVKKDNVTIAACDADKDGKLDFVLGAHWIPFDTKDSGSLHWLKPGAKADEPYSVSFIDQEPTIHRIRWVDIDGDNQPEVVSVPLCGRGSTKPHFAEAPIRITAYKPPADPAKDRWTPTVICEDIHVAHNFFPTDLNRDGKLDILVVSFEGVSLLERQGDDKWKRTLIGTGNQETSPNKGASEIKHGRLRSKGDYIATIEPWHGHQVVTYSKPAAGETLWKRQVVDEDLKWGHAVWCANLDDDEDEELIIGIRDNKDEQAKCGVRIYDPQNADGTQWQRQLIDPGGVAVEDLAAGDLNGDGRVDLVAVGRATKNVRVYWNEKGK